jgi:hypothetical protein
LGGRCSSVLDFLYNSYIRYGCSLGGNRAVNLGNAGCNELKMLSYEIAFLTFWMALGLSAFESVSAEQCLTTPQQLLENKVGDRWKELRQKDDQPLFLTISAG